MNLCTDELPTSRHRYADFCNVQPASAVDHITYQHGSSFDTLSFGRKSQLFERSTVLLIPDLLSKEECAKLVDECEARVKFQDSSPDSWLSATEAMSHDNISFERHEIKDLSTNTQDFFKVLLRQRLLPFISNEMPPAVEESIWNSMEIVWCHPYVPLWSVNDGVAPDDALIFEKQQQQQREQQQQEEGKRTLATQCLKFSESEPTINRYTKGGFFKPHRDALSFTINILLSDKFTGGGTTFWEEMDGDLVCAPDRKESSVNPAEAKEPTLCVLPKVGVGVVFNGTVKHAGRAVEEGVRHLLVASFSVVQKKMRPMSAEFVARRKAQGQVHGDAAERLRRRLAERKSRRGRDQEAAKEDT